MSHDVVSNSAMHLCDICNKPAGKHRYYGARACQGCRAFFRRAQMERRYESFICLSGDGNCKMTPTVKRNCPACRHRKCLWAGMDARSMMSDCERQEKLKKKKELAMKVMPLRATPALAFTKDEMLRLDQILTNAKAVHFTVIADNILRFPSFREETRQLVMMGKSPGHTFVKEYQMVRRRVTLFVSENLEDLAAIDPHDRRYLAENNYLTMFPIMLAQILNEKFLVSHASKVIAYLRPRVHESEIYERLVKDYDWATVNGLKLSCDYEKIFVSPWLSHADQERRHQYLIGRLQSWARDSPEDPKDAAVAILCCLIVLLETPEATRLRNADAATRVQRDFFTLLMRYLSFVHGAKASVRFGKDLALLQLAQEVNYLHLKMLPV